MGKPKGKFKSREKNYDSEDLKKAVAKVKGGSNILKASQTFNVPRSTLSYKCRGHHLSTRKGPEPTLSNDCKEILVEWIFLP